ncbi:MAG: FAD-dependent oxidoreductase [Clostridiaceae bacterium]|nr:FAD-dependent oxidoreductase [Clostridiaceae bacterium]
MREKNHKVDFCVIGGGLAGMLAAISAARHGVKVLLMHDRPVLGGNCSSEIRMWPLGCKGKDNRETGILEEIFIENMHRNPTRNFSIWDSVLYEKVKAEPNITLLLNCSCNGAKMDGNSIVSVRGWQLTSYTWHNVEADYFADCSGDSILAPLTGAEYRVGRESSSEFNEDIAPQKADRRTMGMSCLIQAVERSYKIEYTPPSWAYVYPDESSLPYRDHDLKDLLTNFWWMEVGGEDDSIYDTEELRDELLKIAFGVWDHIKNRGDHGADNWELDWVGFLPGKRESRRYVGDYILNQNDVRSEGKFDDLVAYGGWPMDDHNPAGIRYSGEPTIYHPAPAPFGIPYRCLYSRNIDNLFFAGRNISVTHTALSSTRVMATCAVIGQAVGTAVSIAVRDRATPRDVYENSIRELQNTLMDDDCYLPFHTRKSSVLAKKAKLWATSGDPEPVLNGCDRVMGDNLNAWQATIGSTIGFDFEEPVPVKQIRLVFDSDLQRVTCGGNPVLRFYPTICNRSLDMPPFNFPKTMIKDFLIEYKDLDGHWKPLKEVNGNYQRLVRINTDVLALGVKMTVKATWGNDKILVFSFDVL